MATEITPELVNAIRNLACAGSSQLYISQIIGVPTSTLSDWKRNNPLIRDALYVSQENVISDIRSRVVHIAKHGSDKDALNASTFLINRYEVNNGDDAVVAVSDEDIKQEILNDLSSK